MLYTPKLGGWLPDHNQPGIHEDYKFDELANKLILNESITDGTIDLRRFCPPVENQGHLGSCVGNAVVGGLELLQIKEGIQFRDLSRLFVYYNSRLMSGDQDKDGGTYIRIAMGTLSSIGTCTEQKWPYDVSKVFIRPTWGSYRDAYANKVSGYYRIDGSGQSRVDAVKHALQAQHPVTFGMLVDQNYMNVSHDGLIAMPSANRGDAGGHAQLIVGCIDSQRRYIVRNSWGEDWGDHSYCYVPYDYLDASEAHDLWVPTLTITGL